MAIEAPALQITINDTLVPGAVFLEIDAVSYFSADRFVVGMAIGAGGMSSIDYFAGLGSAMIVIDGLSNGGTANMITGQIDNVKIDFLQNMAVLSGRDLSARLIDMEVSETFYNQTSSQIAQSLAARAGLAANVTPTGTPVGQYYELDHARSALGLHSGAMTAWNLLTSLAQIEGFVTTVTATSLKFGPAAVSAPIILTPASMMSLEIDMATTLPDAVTVKSWNSRSKIVNAQTVGSTNGTTLIRPNLSAAQAGALAGNHLMTLAQHTTILRAEMQGDFVLMPMMQLALNGTFSVLDGNYSIDLVQRSMSARHGFVQTVRAYAQKF